jgi:hypothetical protein
MSDYEHLLALTMWLAGDNGLVNGTKEERVTYFRQYLDCLSLSQFHPIPRVFANEMLEYYMQGILSLSPTEIACIEWNVGRFGPAKFYDIPVEEEEAEEDYTYQGLKLVANPKPLQKDMGRHDNDPNNKKRK